MCKLLKLFTDHPKTANETYWQHLRESLYYGILLIFTGFAGIVHAVFPFLFSHTISNTVSHITTRIEKRLKHKLTENGHNVK